MILPSRAMISLGRARLAALALALSLGLGCDRGRALPATTGVPALTGGATAAAPIKPVAPSRVVANGELIDLREARVVRVLQPALPIYARADRTRAYLLSKDRMLRAFDLASGAEVWSAGPAADVNLRTASEGDAALFFPRAADVWIVDKATGAARAWPASPKVAQVLPLGARLAMLHEDGVVDILDATTLRTEARVPLPMRAEQGEIVALADGGFCAAAIASGGLLIDCFDVRGALRRHHVHALPRERAGGPRPGDPTSRVNFALREVGPRYVVCGTMASDPDAAVRRGVVVRLADGVEIARVEEEVVRVVERDDGALDGFLVVQPEVKLLAPDGRVRWSAGPLRHFDTDAALVSSGTRLYVAIYDQMSSGSALYAFDRATGKILWKGAMDQLPVSHSIYLNDTSMSLFEDRVVLRVDESSVSGVQIFALPTGERIFSNMRFRQ